MGSPFSARNQVGTRRGLKTGIQLIQVELETYFCWNVSQVAGHPQRTCFVQGLDFMVLQAGAYLPKLTVKEQLAAKHRTCDGDANLGQLQTCTTL